MPRTGRRGLLREELRNNLQIGLGTGLIGGGLLGFLAAAATLALDPEILRSTGDTLRLLLGLQLVYAVLCLGLGLLGGAAKTLLYLVTGRRLSDTKTAAVSSGVIFFLLAAVYALSWCRWNDIGGLSPDRPPTLDQAPVLLVIAGVALLLARLVSYAFYLILVHVKKPERRRPGDLRKAFFILLYMAGAFALFVAVMRLTASPLRPQGLTRELIDPDGRKVLLVGTEGMTLQDVGRLRAEGRLAWADPLLQGSTAPLETPPDAPPPMTWTVIATGQDLSAHGIKDVQTQVVRGLSTSVRVGPDQVGLYNVVHTVLPFVRLTRAVTVKSYMRTTKGLWNMASDADLRSATVNWWVSWPAERVRGQVVSDHAWMKLTGPFSPPWQSSDPEEDGLTLTQARAGAGVQLRGEGMIGAVVPLRPDGNPLLLEQETWPNTLLIELIDLARENLSDSMALHYGAVPDQSDLEAWEKLGIPGDVLRSDLFYAQSAAWLLDRESPDLWMLHLPGPDIIRRVLGRTIQDPQARQEARRQALAIYWRCLDPALARVMERVSEPSGTEGDPGTGPTALWVCLPGAVWEDSGERGASGFLALAGCGDAGGRHETPVRLTEIAPTVLWLLGLPVSLDMDGSPRIDLVSAEVAEELSPVRTVPTYGRQEVPDLSRAAGSLDQEMLERFRSLGYIQ